MLLQSGTFFIYWTVPFTFLAFKIEYISLNSSDFSWNITTLFLKPLFYLSVIIQYDCFDHLEIKVEEDKRMDDNIQTLFNI